ncbi:OmpA family protein [Leptotrichia sp.]
MVRKSTVIGLLAMLLVSAPVMARKLTTTQMRENTIRINALEIEEEGAVVEKPQEEVIVLDAGKLNFDFDKDIVKERYFELLRNVKAYAEQKNYAIRIIGHTDSKGSDEYNMKLGMRRAISVRNKLVEFGLDPARIIGVESMGEREPVATNETEEGRFENRRIEFQFSPFQGQ